MTTFKYRPPDLDNRRDRGILMHVFRNFITRPEVVHGLFFGGLSTDTSRKVLRRHVQRGYQTKYPLFANRYYLRLGPHAVSRWGYPPSRTDKLGGQRLPYELGTLAYTCQNERPHKRLLSHELKNRLPWFPDSLMQWAYLWESDRLGSVRVEPRARPQTVVRKLSQQLFRYSELPTFRALIESDRFFFVVVTATEQQELAIQREAAEQGFAVELRTANYPELIRFI